MSDQTHQPELTYAPEQDLRPVAATLIILAATAAVAGLILRNNPVHTVNDGARWDTVYALVHYNSYKIDLGPWGNLDKWPLYPEGPFFTIDMVRRDDHFYSSKPPLLSTIVAGGYYVLNRLTGLKIWYPPEEKEQANSVAGRTLLIVFNVVPFVLFLIFYYRLLIQFEVSDRALIFCLATAAGATYLTAYTTCLTNHLPGAICAFFATYCIIQLWLFQRQGWHLYAGAGFFAGLTSALELPAALFGVVAFCLVLARGRRRTFLYFVPAAVVPIAAFMITNYLATGGLKPDYAYFGTPRYEYNDDSYWKPENRRGIDAIKEPKHIYLTHMLVGHHGIFSLTPVFLFSIVGLILPFRRKLRPLLWVQYGCFTLVTIGILAWYCTQTTNYGGMAHGMRQTFWLIPFWLIVLPQVMERAMDFTITRGLAWICLAFSMMSTAYSAQFPWGMSWIHQLMNYLKVIKY